MKFGQALACFLAKARFTKSYLLCDFKCLMVFFSLFDVSIWMCSVIFLVTVKYYIVMPLMLSNFFSSYFCFYFYYQNLSFRICERAGHHQRLCGMYMIPQPKQWPRLCESVLVWDVKQVATPVRNQNKKERG